MIYVLETFDVFSFFRVQTCAVVKFKEKLSWFENYEELRKCGLPSDQLLEEYKGCRPFQRWKITHALCPQSHSP